MKPRHLIHIFTMLLAALVLSCASDSETDSIFYDIESRIKSDPDSAVRFVDSLSSQKEWQKRLPESARARFDLLRVKSADKAYITHTSDSLIRSVLAYYENHTGSEHYPEALYYGGRVYSDLGDSPTALRYFQQALDVLPEKDTNTGLRCRILSQTGRLLSDLRLHDEAITYINNLLDLEYAIRDSINIMYNLELLGIIYNRKKNYITADSLFRKSLDIAVQCDSDYIKREKVFIAKALLDRGLVDSALNLIRDLPDKINPKYKPQALSTAAEIYYRAERYDTAAIYAKLLIEQNNSHVLGRVGYNMIFKPELIHTLPNDTLYDYIQNYIFLTNEYLQRNSNEFAAIQNSKFNYQKHDEARAVAEEKKNAYAVTGLVLLLVVLGLCLAVAVIRQRNNRNKLDLYKALENIRTLRSLLESAQSEREAKDNGVETEYRPVSDNDGNQNEETAPDHTIGPELLSADEKSCLDITSVHEDADTEEERLRLTLRKELLGLIAVSSKYSRPSKNYVVPERIAKSEAYKNVCRRLKAGKSISYDESMWQDLKNLAEEVWPGLHDRLNMLSESCIRERDYRLCLLIKLGFSPTEITVLLGRTKGTISSRRARLCKEILGENAGATGFDIVILSL